MCLLLKYLYVHRDIDVHHLCEAREVLASYAYQTHLMRYYARHKTSVQMDSHALEDDAYTYRTSNPSLMATRIRKDLEAYLAQHPMVPNDGIKKICIFDIDGTLLRSIPGRGNRKWIDMALGKWLPIIPMIDLYNWCVSVGFHMVLLTNRRISLEKATKENLRNVGISTCHGFYMRGNKTPPDGYKMRCRKAISVRGILVCNVGDLPDDVGPPHALHRYLIAE